MFLLNMSFISRVKWTIFIVHESRKPRMKYDYCPLHDLFYLFDLILNVSSTIFQLYRDGSSWVKPVISVSCSRTTTQ